MSLADYQLSNQISPIILVGGVAGTGALPISSVLSSQTFDQGILGPSSAQVPSDYFGQFSVLPGHTLMDNEVATYPVANQSVAANAIITNPLRVSLEMLVPANGVITFSNKLAIITALKSTLDSHTALGGWYNVATPSYVYSGCLLTNLRDTTDEVDGGQPQIRWIWEFMQPLLTVAAAQAAQNQAMAKITNQTQNSGDPPGSQPVSTGVGQPGANIVQNIVPAASGPVGSNIAAGGTPSGVTSIQSVSPIQPGA